MRDKNLNFIQFSLQVEKYLTKRTSSFEILRRAVIDDPTFPGDDFNLRILSKKLISLRGLAVLSYYVPENLGWKIRGILEDQSNKLCLKDRLKLLLLLNSKETCLFYLYDTSEFSSHEIFGNLLDEGLKSLKTLRISKRKHKVKKPQRKRGYDDKGSLRSPERWLPSTDYSLTKMQLEKETKTDLYNRTKLKIESYLQKQVDQQKSKP